MKKTDDFTIISEPVFSIDLMERAASAFAATLINDIETPETPIHILCGKGNNGGDGLAVARLLINWGYKNILVYVINFSDKQSNDFTTNLTRLAETGCPVMTIDQPLQLPAHFDGILIDAILGSGLNKPLSGSFLELASLVNRSGVIVYAIDVPTGFPAEGPVESYIGIRAFKTICFQRPKINFFFPESASATKSFEVIDIGLDEDFIQTQNTDFYLTEENDISTILKPRENFSHKGTYGHALIIAGHVNTMGAAILASMGCLHAGAGLTTACIPLSGLVTMNSVLPEVMVYPRDEYTEISQLDKYQSVAIGCGLGVSPENEKLLQNLLKSQKPLIIDADGLNMIAENESLATKLSVDTILTPHMKEFDRLFGVHQNWWDRVQTAKRKAGELGVIIVLKNRYTFVCSPDNKVYINSTGNPAMAQGGMGDVLTGIIAAFKAQGYSALNAAILGCYLHGKTGDTLSHLHGVVNASLLAKNISTEIKQYQ